MTYNDTLTDEQELAVGSAMLRFDLADTLIQKRRALDWSREETYWHMVCRYVGENTYPTRKAIFNMLWPEPEEEL